MILPQLILSHEMTLHYWVIVERYPILNEVVSNSIPPLEPSLYLTEKLAKQVGSQEPTHRKVGNKPHPIPKRFFEQDKTTILKFTPDCPTLIIYSDEINEQLVLINYRHESNLKPRVY
jgi:hypothetical protein